MNLPQQCWYVYILLCSDGKTYVGCTGNLGERIQRHQEGRVHSTKDRHPFKVVTYIVFTDKSMAFRFEKYLKTGSGRAFLKKRFIQSPKLRKN